MPEAIAACRKAVERNPRYAEALANLGSALTTARQSEEAVQQFNAALRFSPAALTATHYYDFGNALLQTGRLDDAMEAFRRAVLLNPRYAAALNALAVLSNTKGKPDDAIGYLREALKITPNDPAMHNSLGNVLEAKGLGNEAMLQYQEALRIDTNNLDAHLNLGFVLGGLGKTNEAVAHLNEVLRLKPDHAAAKEQLQLLGK